MPTTTLPLQLDLPAAPPGQISVLSPSARVLHGFAERDGEALLSGIQGVGALSPFRQMVTRGGWTMSVAMTNCGAAGWVSDRRGYRYDALDPASGRRWPAMPALFLQLAHDAAAAAGFQDFVPDACLINQYRPGARLSLHQDLNERDYTAPIVSVSLGVSATFLWGGATRAERPVRVPLAHGDVVVWGGADRMAFHGVLPLPESTHPLTGNLRYNLTFRKAL